jgi:hypothetical protein
VAAPQGYTQTPYGTWVRNSDGAGPFTIDCGRGTTGPYVQIPSSGYFVATDGSGPYTLQQGQAVAAFPSP